ncbi:glycosyltransferase family 4 protein [Mucilaginibacter endophyticus]|uniref:glycosyltransferase family 4 protein n=1 Tax=Mucilaginibacter endophyticus TaxID=2675003 RepID=UPI000E0D3897|nr:glycosyltransferase family 1 protein [Mucilaginibacter endophyticus]
MNNHPKKIAFISEHASPLAHLGGVDTGGQNVYVAQLAKHLADRGHSIDVYTRREDGSTEDVIEWIPNIRVIHVKAGPERVIAKEEILPYMPEFDEWMQSFIKDEKLQYDLVHANFFMSGLVAMNIKLKMKIPFVITFHALGHVRRLHQKDKDQFPDERLDIETLICKEADQIIAECPQDREDLIQHYHADIKKISIVPCGFSQTEFYPVDKEIARKMLMIKSDEKVLLQLGRMVPRKGIDNVIRSVASLKKNAEKVKVLIVGGSQENMAESTCPEYHRLSALAAELGIRDKVQFVGKKSREYLKFYYAAADIFITTPWYEPFGITPLEAMACGTPVIGSNVGGIKYSVVDGVTGALVPPKDAGKLARKVDELIGNEAILTEMGRNALKHVNENFTWKKIANEIELVYKTVLRQTANQFTRKNITRTEAA